MDYGLINAELINKNSLAILYYGESSDINDINFKLEVNGTSYPLRINRFSRSDKLFRIEASSDVDIILGNVNNVKTNVGDEISLDYRSYVTSKEFDELYCPVNEEFGAFYFKEETVFKFWSPISDKVFLKLEKSDSNFVLLQMKRKEKGVYKLTVKGDLFNKKYNYVIHQGGTSKEIRDPYGIGTSLNSKYSAVIDLSALNVIAKEKPKSVINKANEAVIYEMDIRDFTEADKNNESAGKYLGVLNKIDYLKNLGVTHVQLLPVHDFFGVDDIEVDHYNWGYNPTSYFSLEGSYSNYPEDPLARLLEFKKLVTELHKNDIRVILDVVYNHIYEYQNSDFHKNLPNYYFRRLGKKISEGSGCGNDIASERSMVRKHILDSLKYFTETFDLDGYRFDLLGLIDLETAKEAVKVVKSIKPDALMYGEGWDMMTGLSKDKKCCSDNAHQIPEMGFFNDQFRDVIKGGTFDKYSKGFIMNEFYKDDLNNVLCACLLKNRYDNASQSINYVECHDNQTLFDKISYFSDNDELNLQIVKFANAMTLLSIGVPFIHMGQEIGLSKCMLDNTYNVPKVNNMDWDLVESRHEMVKFMKELIKVRKTLPLFKANSASELENVYINYLDNGLVTITVTEEKLLLPGFKEGLIIINPSEEVKTLELKDYYQIFFGCNGIVEDESYARNFTAADLSVSILGLK